MRKTRRWPLAAGLALIAAGLAAVASAAPAGAATELTVGMPFTGKWAYNVPAAKPYDDVNDSHPAAHEPYGANWATDLYTAAGTDVRVNVSGDPTLKVVSVTDTSCKAGKRVKVEVKIGTELAGYVSYEHLETSITTGTILNNRDPLIGKTKYWGNLSCYQVSDTSGTHVHVSFTGTNSATCYIDKGQPGAATLNAGEAIGKLGSSVSGTKQACPVTLTGGSPDLVVEAVYRAPGGVHVQGRASDPNSTSPVYVQAYGVNGDWKLPNGDLNRTSGDGYANRYRADIGSATVYDIFVPAGPGMHDFCVFAHNTPGTPGETVKKCYHAKFAVVADTVGNAEIIQLLPNRVVRVAGWALDPDIAGPIQLHVYLDGTIPIGPYADRSRPDVAQHWPFYGPNHGFDATFTMPPGTHRVCVFAINAGGTYGISTLLRCQDLTG